MRKSVNPGHDRKVFRNTARVHRDVNLKPISYRGGIRF